MKHLNWIIPSAIVLICAIIAWGFSVGTDIADLQNEVTHLATKVDLLETEQRLLDAINNL